MWVAQVLVALVYLMEEVQELCVVAEDKHFPKLAIFGESGKLGEDPLTPGDRERRIGRVLPFLQVRCDGGGPERPWRCWDFREGRRRLGLFCSPAAAGSGRRCRTSWSVATRWR